MKVLCLVAAMLLVSHSHLTAMDKLSGEIQLNPNETTVTVGDVVLKKHRVKYETKSNYSICVGGKQTALSGFESLDAYIALMNPRTFMTYPDRRSESIDMTYKDGKNIWAVRTHKVFHKDLDGMGPVVGERYTGVEDEESKEQKFTDGYKLLQHVVEFAGTLDTKQNK